MVIFHSYASLPGGMVIRDLDDFWDTPSLGNDDALMEWRFPTVFRCQTGI